MQRRRLRARRSSLLLAALLLLQWDYDGCKCAMHRFQRWTAAMQFCSQLMLRQLLRFAVA